MIFRHYIKLYKVQLQRPTPRGLSFLDALVRISATFQKQRHEASPWESPSDVMRGCHGDLTKKHVEIYNKPTM